MSGTDAVDRRPMRLLKIPGPHARDLAAALDLGHMQAPDGVWWCRLVLGEAEALEVFAACSLGSSLGLAPGDWGGIMRGVEVGGGGLLAIERALIESIGLDRAMVLEHPDRFAAAWGDA